MYINENGHIVIEDKFICEFVKLNETSELFEMVQCVLKSVFLSYNIKNTKDKFKDEFIEYFKENTSEIISAINNKKIDVSPVIDTLVKNNEEEKKQIVEYIKNVHENENLKLEKIDNSVSCIYDLNKTNFQNLENKISVDGVVKQVLEDNKINSDYIAQYIEFSLEKTKLKIDEVKNLKDTKMIEDVGSIKSCLEKLEEKIETLSSLKKTNKHKGDYGEKELLTSLEFVLPIREGFIIENTSSIPHACDMCVKKSGFPDIRLEVKAYGKDNGLNVPTAEVRKFESDISNLNSHGIFISLYGGICGKSSIEINLMHNNKLAVYLSNNNFDAEIIRDFVGIIYKIDDLKKENEGFTIDIENMEIINSTLLDYCNQMKNLKSHLRSSINIANEISLENIIKLISGRKKPVKEEETKKNPCRYCNKNYASKAGLTSHEKTCKSKTDKI